MTGRFIAAQSRLTESRLWSRTVAAAALVRSSRSRTGRGRPNTAGCRIDCTLAAMLRNSVSKLSLVFAFFLSVSPACGEADELGRGAGGSSGGTPASAAREGTVRGLVRDAQGRPLAGAEINISNAVYVTSPVSGASGADGAYLLELPPNQVWRAYG